MHYFHETVSSQLGISPPTNVTAVQTGPTSILVSWTPPNDAIRCRIGSTHDGDGGGHISGATIFNTGSYTFVPLQNGLTYTILSILALSGNIRSEIVTVNLDIALGKVSILLR